MPDSMDILAFTGERVVPGRVNPDLYYEHVTRYQFAAELSGGRRVLDAGCGTGYGTRLLARDGSFTVGLDRSEEAVHYAAAHFPAARLRYLAGECEQLPFADSVFDLVVSFEVIEHLNGPERFLQEIKRVLSPGGVLVVSTPNKRQYTDERPGYANPFHVREYYFAEWAELLERVFPAVRHFDQQYAQGLAFVERDRDGRPARTALPRPEMAHDDTGNGYADGGHEAAQFFVAVCASDATHLPDLLHRQFLLSGADILAERTKWIRLLGDEVEAGRTQIRKANQMLEDVHRELEGRTRWARAAAKDVADREERIRELEARLAAPPSLSVAAPHDADPLHTLAAKLDALAARQEEMLEVLEGLLNGFASLKESGAAGEDLQYRQLLRRLRKVIDGLLPPNAAVLVVSKGDDALLDLGGRAAKHFPQGRDGHYAGFNPADSGSAIVQLEALRAQGAQYLLLPGMSLWWLNHYQGLRRHLDRHYRLLLRQEDVCAVYSLWEPPAVGPAGAAAGMAAVIEDFVRRFDRQPAVLDWDSGLRLAQAFPELMVFSPPGPSAAVRLPYLDGTIDVVAVGSLDPAVRAEADRLAVEAVVTFPPESVDPARAPQVRWLHGTTAAAPPSVSIVIPSYNGSALTDACLKALADTLPVNFHGEIIVVDDCSTDDTQSRLAPWARREPRLNVKLLCNPQNSGFVSTCNNGAAAATGEFVILMNNDTLPQRGWLEPLLRTFRDHPDAGAVGSKLVYPDGRLQEAGGVVFSDGSAANFGKFEHQLDLPLYNYVREVDYVTGALIATPRAVLNELGGLDTRYKPIYYEETDYCFKLRERGYKVYYQPESVVIHLEGVTCGTDPGSGQKRFQVVNREKFVERWRDALRHQPAGPGRFDRSTWHMLAVRGGCSPQTADAGAVKAGSNGGGLR